MSHRVFIDTNIFIYALDTADIKKQQQAIELISSHRNHIVISTQVLIEVAAVCMRKLGMRRIEASQTVAELAKFPTISTDTPLVLEALETSVSAQISVFDALVITAAASAKCATLYSEDLADGQEFGALTVRNPFA